MVKFQRRHYEAIAECLAYSDARDYVIYEFIQMFEEDNDNFDRGRFRERLDNLRKEFARIPL